MSNRKPDSYVHLNLKMEDYYRIKDAQKEQDKKVNYSNSQRAGVILYLTALIFGAYDIAEGKGVHREEESEGSRMWEQTNHGQISGLTDRNHI